MVCIYGGNEKLGCKIKNKKRMLNHIRFGRGGFLEAQQLSSKSREPPADHPIKWYDAWIIAFDVPPSVSSPRRIHSPFEERYGILIERIPSNHASVVSHYKWRMEGEV